MSSSSQSSSNVKIIIIGAGICGLMTAIQLERAGMDYIVVEKARALTVFGAGLSLTPACNYILDQLGMLEEINKVSHSCSKIDYLREDLSKVGVMNAGDNKGRYGYDGILITRPAFYDILLSKVPKEKIHWGKRMVGFKQDEHSVEIECQDNLDPSIHNVEENKMVTYTADILIGADGAYSAVRRKLYESMQAKGLKLPREDLAPLRFDSNCVIGVTDVLTEEEYPVLKEKSGDLYVLIDKKKAIQVYLFTFAENRLGWHICGRMDKPEEYDEKDFRFSDWKPAAAGELCEMVRHFKCPFGGTIGNVMDRTPKERLSQVMLEDKYFSTWYHQRTVLMGDACHKHLPFGGQGANQAILDSVHLVNQLYGIPSNSLQDITKWFKAYYGYRSPNAKEVFKSTSLVASILSSRGYISDVVRFFALGHLPDVINNLGMDVSIFVATCNVPATVTAAPRPWSLQWHQQIPFLWNHPKPVASPPSPPIPDLEALFIPKKQIFKLQHVLAHGAPGTKSANVFRRLEIDDETRLEMAQVNRLLGNHDTGYAGTMFEHTLSDTAFTVEDSEEGDDNDDDNDGDDDEAAQNLIPLPWKRVPNAKDHGTVVSMIRMSLDCYVDPKRQGWVDIGDKWEVETEIGWLEAGLRGYIFVSEDKKTVVLGIKGTSLKLFGTGGGPTANKDKKNDNKMFSCCCGKVDRTWWAVCGCYMGGSQCSQQCLVDDLVKDRDEEESYHGIGLKVIEVVRDLYPNADIWLTGHSLGGGVASMLGVTKGYPVFTFQTPGDVRYAQRIGLVKQQLKSRDLKKMPVWHFGHTADPVFMGTCNGPMSTCYSAGYALETKCHLGRTCIYDTMTELGWRQSIQSHTIFTFINVVENWPNMTQGREIVGPCLPQTECQDCAQWEYV